MALCFLQVGRASGAISAADLPRVSIRQSEYTQGASGDLASLVSLADMPNPDPKTDELLEQAKYLAGELNDQRTITIFSALLIAEAIRSGTGRITEAITKDQ